LLPARSDGDMMENPTIEILGVKVLEPVTTFTDIIVAVVCFYAWYKLRQSGKKEPIYTYTQYFFITMGLATLIGGIIGHAFLYYFSFAWKIPGWYFSMVSVALLERASIEHVSSILKPKVAKALKIINIAELLTFAVIAAVTLNFIFVEIHAAYGILFVVFSIQTYVYVKTKDRGSLIFMTGVLFSTIAAVVHLSKFSFSQWFNYMDISHVLMAISAYLFYKGTINFKLAKKNS
jgi:drug/metabolite transporter superfamily protein YnfA